MPGGTWFYVLTSQVVYLGSEPSISPAVYVYRCFVLASLLLLYYTRTGTATVHGMSVA